jgi:DNA mismatch endonuclease (patch repair protein)
MKLEAPTPEVSARMKAVRVRGTTPEVRVQSLIRARKIRYTTKTSHLPGKPDFILTELTVAIFVHGCFWHGCPECFVAPVKNHDWWCQKIAATRRRDRRKADQLRNIGYSVLTFWEHDSDRRMIRRLDSLVVRRLDAKAVRLH